MLSVAHSRSASATEPSAGRSRPRLRDGPRRSVHVVTPPADDSLPDPFSALPISIASNYLDFVQSPRHRLGPSHSLPDLRSCTRPSGVVVPLSPSTSSSSPPPLTPASPPSRPKPRSRKRESLAPSGLVTSASTYRPVRTQGSCSPRALSIIPENEEHGRSARQRMRDERRRRERAPVRGAGRAWWSGWWRETCAESCLA